MRDSRTCIGSYYKPDLQNDNQYFFEIYQAGNSQAQKIMDEEKPVRSWAMFHQRSGRYDYQVLMLDTSVITCDEIVLLRERRC